MAVIIASQKEIDAYYESSDLNQSTLKDLRDGLANMLAKIEKRERDKEEGNPEPIYFLFGGAVDTILTGEEGEFEKQYHVSKLEKTPSEIEIKIISDVFNELHKDDLLDQVEYKDCYDLILYAADTVPNGDKVGWQMNWKADTRVAKLIEAGEEYFNDLKKSLGKKIISSEQRKKIDDIVYSLRTNERTAKYFDRDTQKKIENVDFYYQLPIYFSYKGVACKALMDMVIVVKDEKGNIIKIEPIDLKTMSGDTLQFNNSMKTHRYDIQAAWYVLALKHKFNVSEDIIAPFKFIVESTTNVGKPLVYEVDNDVMVNGKWGAPEGIFSAIEGARQLHYRVEKGYEDLIEEYLYYAETGFTEDRILLENEGPIKLSWHKGILS